MRLLRKLALALGVCFFAVATALAQSVMLQGWYWDYPKGTGAQAWSEVLAARASDLGNAGFTHVWLPPLSRASFGFGSNGYDPKDLYDLGEFGLGPTGYGTRAQVDASIAALKNNGLSPVADVVYNHRDGGNPEVNPAVKAYITTHYTAAKQPMPSDRYYVRLPLGGTSGNGAGDYYFKLSSKSGASRFVGADYRLYMSTSTRTASLATVNEVEPNGGGDCGQAFQTYALNANLLGELDGAASGCQTDEFKVTIGVGDFAAAGDYLNLYVTNTGGYSDHRFYGIWNASAARDVAGDLEYLSYTDFTAMPSGQGAMNFENFRPNSANASTTYLDGDWDYPYFFYDYDQSQPTTVSALNAWTQWLMTNVGIEGLRMDAVKHFPPAFVGQLLSHLEANGQAPSIAVGEFFDGNPTLLASWINGVSAAAPGLTTPIRAFDFSLRDALKQACDNASYDVRNVFSAGLVDAAGMSGFNSVTFVNNHDFRGPGEPVQSDPLLAYVYILTNNQVGLPTVFYPDYYGDAIPNSPTLALKPTLDSLIAFQASNIAGAQSRTYLNKSGSGFAGNYLNGAPEDALIYQIRDAVSGRDVIVAINFGAGPLRVDQAINRVSGLPTGTRFDDVMGRSAFPYAQVDAQGRIFLDLPARSFSIWQEASSVPLPVTLSSLSAKPAGSANLITWTAASEQNLDRYVLERASKQADAAFSAVTEVAARGAALGVEAVYAAYDPSPSHRSYYRLRAVDLDGSVEYSDVVAVQRPDRPSSGIKLYPNPSLVGQSVLLELGEALGDVEVEITIHDAAGRQVGQSRIAAAGVQALSLGTLPAGVYQVSALWPGGMERQRLVIE